MRSRLVGFLSRHRWSLPLALSAAGAFAHLASELGEGSIKPFDAEVASWVVLARGGLDTPMLALTRLGDGVTLTLIVVSVVALLTVKGRRREARFLAGAGIGTFLLTLLLKLAFRRPRPGSAALYLLTEPSSFSFPSGHALGSTGVLLSLVVVARLLGVRGWLWALAATTAALLVVGVATSRVYFGVHFPSDVLGGLLAGAAWVSAVTGWFYPRLLPGEEAAPGHSAP